MTTHRIYWCEENIPEWADHTEIPDALKMCEALRQRRAAGEKISHIVMSSEIDDCTSLTGVAAPAPDYHWRKRRV